MDHFREGSRETDRRQWCEHYERCVFPDRVVPGRDAYVDPTLNPAKSTAQARMNWQTRAKHSRWHVC